MTIDDIKNAINEILIDSDSADTPAGAIRVLVVTDDSTVIRRIYRRGIAVAVRGVTLEVDTATGNVVRTAPLTRGIRQ